MNKREDKKRLDYIDVCKALGMVLIMWGHIVEYGMSHNFVYAFHIPLFFTLSGMVFSKDRYPNLKVFLSKKTKSLLIPYAIFSLITWSIWAIWELLKGAPLNTIWYSLFETVIAQGSGGFLVHNVPLWFVTCLFVVELMYYLISKLPDLANIAICATAMVLGVWMQQTTLFDFKLSPWNIEVALAAIIFFSLGNIFIKRISNSRYIEFVSTHKIASAILIVTGFIITYIIALYNGKVSMGSCRLNNPFLFYPGAICGTISLVTLCVLISKIKENFVLKQIKWFGKNSFNAMAIHNPLKGVIVIITASILHATTKDVQSFTLSAFAAFIILFIATIICMMLITRITNIFKTKRHETNCC